MAPMFLPFCSVFMLVFPTMGAATEVSTNMFPALKKRLEAKKLAETRKHAEQSLAQVPETASEDTEQMPVDVPSPLDVGADGYPKLPAVSEMLSAASGTLKSVSSQASDLQARMVDAQMHAESKLAKQKSAFEQKLNEQEKGNRAVITANDKITTEIEKLKSGNTAIRKHARELQENNRLMRSELHTMQSRLGVATDFLAKALTSTDDSKNAMLQVLKGGTRHHQPALVETASKKHEDDDSDDDDSSENSEESEDESDDQDEGASLLEVSERKVHRSSADGAASFEEAMNDLEAAVPSNAMAGLEASTPSSSTGDMLEMLAKDVAHLSAQEKESEKNLRNLFIRDFRAGAKRHQALLVQQKGLIATRGSLMALEAKLKTAEGHLENTRKHLEGKLHGIGQFLQKLAHFAMAPTREVPHLLEGLPKSVVVKGENVI